MLDITKLEPHKISTETTGTYLFYGEPGSFKTTVASKFPSPLLLAADVGYTFIDGIKAVNIDSWATLKTIKRQLDLPMARSMYQTIILDGVNLIYDMSEEYVLTQKNISELGELGFGAGHSRRRKEFQSLLSSITQKGYSVVMICHSSVEEESEKDDKGKTVKTGKINIKPKLPASAEGFLVGLSDFVFYCKKEPKDDNPSIVTSYAYTNTPSNIVTKSRLAMANRFEFTYENLQKQLENSIDTLKSSGVEITTGINNKVNEKMPFSELKDLTTGVASVIINSENMAAIEEAQKVIVEVLKCKISEVTDGQYDALEVAYQELSDIKERFKL